MVGISHIFFGLNRLLSGVAPSRSLVGQGLGSCRDSSSAIAPNSLKVGLAASILGVCPVRCAAPFCLITKFVLEVGPDILDASQLVLESFIGR